MPACISEVTFFLAISDDILDMITFSVEIIDTATGSRSASERVCECDAGIPVKSGIKRASESSDK